jgi:hypothetical protein
VDIKTEAAQQVAKATPAVAGATIAGLTLNEWVAIATITYIVLQAGYLLWKWRRELKKK